MAHVLDILLALKSTLIPSSHDAAVKWMVQIALGSLTLLFFIRLLGPKRFKDEPPYINPKVPLIGHAIGLVRKRYGYLVDLLSVSKLNQIPRFLADETAFAAKRRIYPSLVSLVLACLLAESML